MKPVGPRAAHALSAHLTPLLLAGLSKGSGSIDVRNVRGDFTVRSIGSASISHEAIGGAVRIPERR